MTERETVPDVFGVETEYSCMLVFPGNTSYEFVGGCHSDTRKMDLYKGPTSTGANYIDEQNISEALGDMGLYSTSDGMLSNGGRFYIDPSGPEYATPETTTAEEAVHRTFDGDNIVLGMLHRLTETGALQSFQLNRRLVDHNRSSRGVHLNTTTNLSSDPHPEKDVIDTLATLNVVKGAMFGSGGLLVDRYGDTSFHHSPRLSITTETDGHYHDYLKRPLVRYPFKEDGEKLARIETVTSDALNFGWPLRASLVVTNSLVRLLEIRRDIDIPYLLDAELAAKTVGEYGHDSEIDVLYDKFGEYAKEKPLTVLRNICELLLNADEVEEMLSREARQVLPEVIDVADRMAEDPTSVAHQVESMARLLAMERRMEKNKLKINSEKMCRFDFTWDLIGGGVAETLRKRNFSGWHGFKEKYSPHATARRLNTPPSDTRAKERGEFIRDSEGSVEISWSGTKHHYFPPISATK